MKENFIDQLKEMKEQMDHFYQKILTKKVTTDSPQGYVRVIVNGRKDIEEVEIRAPFLTEEKAQYLAKEIKSAINAGLRKAEDMTTKEIGEMAQGLNFNDFL